MQTSTFLKFVFGGIAVGLCLTLGVAAEPFKEPVGLQLESVNGPLRKDMAATLEKVHGWGFTEVELVGDYKLSPSALKAELAEHKLKAVSAHFPYATFRDAPEKLAEEAKALGLVTIGCPSVPQHDAFDEAGCREAAEMFNHAGQIMSEHGITFFYHPHGYEFKPFGQGTLFDLLVTNTNPKYVHFQMDIYWVVHAGQDPIKLLKRYPNRWVSMHLKDMRKGAPTGIFNGTINRKDFVPIGQGQIDIVGAMQLAHKLGVKSYIIEDESNSVDTGIPQSLSFLNSVAW